jgi:hypothetical protein
MGSGAPVGATPCLVDVKRRVVRVLALALAPASCLTDVPGLAAETETETDGSDDATSPTSAPGSTGADDDADADADASAEGTVDDSDGSSDGTPCEDGDPECMDPGEAVWTVVLGEAGYDAAYALAVDGDRVLVVGERNSVGADSAPWSVRLAGADGAMQWERVSSANPGHSDLRGIVPMGDGRSIAVGNVPGESVKTAGYMEARDDAGESGFAPTYEYANTNYLLGVLADDAGGFHAVGYTGEPPGSIPLVLHYSANMSGGWEYDISSDDLGVFGFEGQLFGLDHAPNGNLVIVGARVVGDNSDAMVLVTNPQGDLLDEYMTGGAMDDGFVDVDVDADGLGVAIGRTATGDDSGEVLMLHFTLGDSLVSDWEHSWSEVMSTNANGFARDGDTVYIAAGTLDDPKDFTAYDSLVIRWDGENEEPTWAVPFEPDMAGRDYAMDVALYDDATIVACGVLTPDDADVEDAWIRRLAR